jgi:hypothetical protein
MAISTYPLPKRFQGSAPGQTNGMYTSSTFYIIRTQMRTTTMPLSDLDNTGRQRPGMTRGSLSATRKLRFDHRPQTSDMVVPVRGRQAFIFDRYCFQFSLEELIIIIDCDGLGGLGRDRLGQKNAAPVDDVGATAAHECHRDRCRCRSERKALVQGYLGIAFEQDMPVPGNNTRLGWIGFCQVQAEFRFTGSVPSPPCTRQSRARPV